MLDPAGYGALTITKAISIQGHGFSGISISNGNAITINAGASDKISLRGLLIDGVGSGTWGILFHTGGSLDVQECLIRNFNGDGILFVPSGTSKLFVSNTTSEGHTNEGISIDGPGNASGVFDHVIVAANGLSGLDFNNTGTISFTVSNSVTSNNQLDGVTVFGGPSTTALIVLQNVIVSNNGGNGLFASGSTATIRFTKSTITGNGTSFATPGTGQIWSYGDNIIDGNVNNFLPSKTPLN